ncbi:Smr/MutS family protein [Solemya elarraichensis gill symbiont]|uniref:Smr domain-containing protein n=1 Tax=Solemya elarraichensis gill symbiont TaxID=1918949 RepID=A0A1T2L5P7_9GAMM|nr:Smr/MutS family protein [Solemya elarraichensis gill symbiont]OOZ40360.1 hypothetical protein BOW52_05940 [Solemya elarraichensis gill symbiont]
MNDDKKNQDLELFHKEMKGVKQLEQERIDPFRKKLRPEPLPKQPEEEEDTLADLNIETPDFLDFQHPGVQNRLYQDLKRGLLPPEATLDLHGMRVVEARKALLKFLAQAAHRHYRTIRIIHGKGRGSTTQPVLKQKVNQWLQQREDVLAFTTAPRWDGGTGAAYVLLSKKHWD